MIGSSLDIDQVWDNPGLVSSIRLHVLIPLQAQVIRAGVLTNDGRVDGDRCQLVGVDVITNDPSVSLAQSGGVFLEVNTTPGIHHHYHTREEHERHPVATKVLQHLLQVGTHGAEHKVGVAGYDYNRLRGDIRG